MGRRFCASFATLAASFAAVLLAGKVFAAPDDGTVTVTWPNGRNGPFVSVKDPDGIRQVTVIDADTGTVLRTFNFPNCPPQMQTNIITPAPKKVRVRYIDCATPAAFEVHEATTPGNGDTNRAERTSSGLVAGPPEAGVPLPTGGTATGGSPGSAGAPGPGPTPGPKCCNCSIERAEDVRSGALLLGLGGLIILKRRRRS